MLNYGQNWTPDYERDLPVDIQAGAGDMYRSFTIKNFRCFDELTVEGMGRINLIAGKNNVGKTALLEALWVHSWPIDPNFGLQIDLLRGLDVADPDNFMSNLFRGFDRNLTIELSAKGKEWEAPRMLKMWMEDSSNVLMSLPGSESAQPNSMILQSRKSVVMEYSFEAEGSVTTIGRIVAEISGPNSPRLEVSRTDSGQKLPDSFSTPFLAAIGHGLGPAGVNIYSDLEINDRQNGILRILQEVEPTLKRLSVVATLSAPRIYADVGMGRLIPVQLMGDGMSRILSLALAIASNPGGIVLVDEIENGIHYSVMEKVWKAIGSFARSYDVQIFATTHSRECVYYAHRAFEADEEEEFRFFRIDRAYGKLRTVMYDKEMREAAFETGLGMR